MRKEINITKIDTVANYVSISIVVNDDGSIRVSDYSDGEVAEEVYGHDVDHYLDLDAQAVKKLVHRMQREVPDGSPVELANHIAERFKGQNLALTSIKELCDQFDVPYCEEFWP